MLLQEDLAKLVSIELAELQDYEKGRRTVPSRLLVEVSKILEKPVDWFYAERPTSLEGVPTPEEDEEYAECLILLSRVRNNGTLGLVKDILKLAASND